MTIEFAKVKKILVVKLRAIGDVVLSTVVLQSLRTAFPHAQLDFLAEKHSREVVEGNPAVDTVIVFDAMRESSIGLILKVRNRKYDLVIDLFGNPRSAIMTFFSGAAYRVGYRFTWRQYCYNIVVEPRGGEIHNTEFNLDALRAINVPILDSAIQFPLNAVAERFAEDFFLRENLIGKCPIAFNPGGGWYTKRWRIAQFAELGDVLVKKYDARVLIVWGPGEWEDARQVQLRMLHPSLILPQTSLKQLAAILKRCTLFVTNDSGPMHIAAAVGTPVVAIFGPTNPDLQGPVGGKHEVVRNERLLCLGCNFTDCPIGNPCMLELSVDEVVDGVRRAAEKNNLKIETHVPA